MGSVFYMVEIGCCMCVFLLAGEWSGQSVVNSGCVGDDGVSRSRIAGGGKEKDNAEALSCMLGTKPATVYKNNFRSLKANLFYCCSAVSSADCSGCWAAFFLFFTKVKMMKTA